ncbi:ATP-dependent RNA helicase mrh-4, mitochondrial [Apodospora peruviana]|uniref:RNA helicase n=1 Tax=Apodospora peruviana TaxID=516989 RepID=A0AAE0M894_9PEZI|nr:ATP-dependent RNA helicase mrh-4, mitochondrial [Apodospora peruviana]
MWRIARESVCLFCRSAATRPRAGLELSRPWVEHRAFATVRGRDDHRTPSRMVLSDRVARPPSARDGGSGGSGGHTKKPRNYVDGPFAAMNRTTANIRPRGPPRPGVATGREERDGRDSRNRRDGKDGKRGGREPMNFKALKMQRSLTTIGYGERTHIKTRMQTVENFDQFDLLPVMKEAIKESLGKRLPAELGVEGIKPTPVQRLAIPALLGQSFSGRPRRKVESGREEFLLAAETGSGKTLAYLLPAINTMKTADEANEFAKAYNERLAQEKERRGDVPVSKWIEKFEPHPDTARPRVVVLVPTAELVDQVTAVAKSISHVAKIKVRPVSASFNADKIQRNLYSHMGVDLVIATPHLLATIASSDPNILSRVTHLVIDEADSLLDRSFSPETTKIIDRAMPSLKQLIMCSATIPRRLDTYLAERFPDIVRITTPNLHAIPRRVQLGVVDASKDPYRNNKNLACADAIWSIGKVDTVVAPLPGTPAEIKRIMVFVNEREKTQEVAEYLMSKGIDAVALHRDTPEQRQSEMLASFTSSEPMKVVAAGSTGGHQVAPTPSSRRRLPNTKVIVATDLASRGIDTLAVKHVVLYDVPHTTIDFIHRLGRAGRMGRRGRGIVIVGKDDRRDIVAEVKESMFMGQALV